MKIGLNMFLILIILSTGISLGILKGKAIKEAEYQAEYQRWQNEKTEFEGQKADEEKPHAKRIAVLEDQLRKLKDDYDADIIRLNADHAQRLLDAEQRAAKYFAISQSCGTTGGDLPEGGADGCEQLARIAGAFDRNLVEGVTVVTEFRRIAERVGAEVDILTKVVEEDRKLMKPR